MANYPEAAFSDTITQAGALKAAVRHVRREVNATLDGIEQSLERNVAGACTACGLPMDQVVYDICLMTTDRKHRLPNEVRLKEPV